MTNDIINNRVLSLRKYMKENNIDAMLIADADYHNSESVAKHFKEMEFISGFTGTDGTVLVTLDKAILWTDGRYFIQAEKELSGTCFELYKMGNEGVPTITEFIKNNLNTIKIVGCDGRCFSNSFISSIIKTINTPNCIKSSIDPINDIWNDRPSIVFNNIFELDIKYSGEDRISKINNIIKHLEEKKATTFVVSSLDDIAWILNLRGSDIDYNPVFLSYLIINNKEVSLYVDSNAVKNVKESLTNDGIIVKDYLDIYKDVLSFNDNSVVIFDKSSLNYELSSSLSKYKCIYELNYSTELKACKNSVEVKNSYIAHIKDGVALTKFIYYLKHHNNISKEDEISIADYLEELRSKNENFIGLSFPTIAGYKANGAIVHYSATNESKVNLDNKSFVLVDSGAQYLEGTTDVTRTISLGELTDKEKKMYTLVLKGHLALGDALFKKGTTGSTLDILARSPLWSEGLDYNHGTGHGVGSCLNVHEGPQNISPKVGRSAYSFKPGMITSNEPGLYFENEFGIRIENLVLCIEDTKNEFGEFYKFDTLTLVPYDVEAIDKTLLNKHEVKLIHDYHERIYNTLHDYLTKEELSWLESIVKAI